MQAFLSRDDVRRLTKRTYFAAQRRALERLGIRYTTAADGEPLVNVEALDVSQARRRNTGPHWDRIAG